MTKRAKIAYYCLTPHLYCSTYHSFHNFQEKNTEIQHKSSLFYIFFVSLHSDMHLQNMAKLLLLTLVVVLLAVILLSIKMILRKDGRFSSIHISDSKAMRERGIHCATSQDREIRRKSNKKIDVKQL